MVTYPKLKEEKISPSRAVNQYPLPIEGALIGMSDRGVCTRDLFSEVKPIPPDLTGMIY